MTKICHITTVHPPFDTRIFYKECKTLNKAGYEVCLISQHDREEIREEIHIIPLPKVRSRLKRMIVLPVRALMTAIKLNADLYHFHDPELILVGVLLKIFTWKKVIYDIHENVRGQILDKDWIPKNIRGFIVFLYHLLENLCLIFIDRIVVVLDSYRKIYGNYRIVISIRNFPCLEYSNKLNGKVAKNIDVVYAGGISKIRGIFEILETAKILGNNISFILVGHISHSLEVEVNDFILSQNLANIKFLGTVPHEEVYKIIKRSKVGLAIFHPRPNHIESYPNKLFEYMSVGLPVVVSNFPLWREIVEGNNCGICVDPLNPKEIADAIKYILDHPDEARKMGENGRKAVLEKYNWESEGKKLVELYREILKKR